jgi:hypothetical protein
MDKTDLAKEKARLSSVLEHTWLLSEKHLREFEKNGLDYINKFARGKPFLNADNPYDLENPHIHLLKIFRNPEYLYFTCKHLFGIELLPFQLVILEELWKRPFPMLIASRGASKSFCLALYAMIRAFISQGSKLILVGSSFRQSKVLFEYCEAIWSNALVLQSIIGFKSPGGRKNGPRRDIDRCEMVMGDSVIISLPIGNGDKIRGQRGSHLIVDEFRSVPVEVFENVISGFAAVSSSPIEKVKDSRRIKILKSLGYWTEEQASEYMSQKRGNQLIIGGTPGYDFEPFADYWKRYKSIVESKGDKAKLEEIFAGEIPEAFNWKDYSVIRIPYELVTEMAPGFMDEKTVMRFKLTAHASMYMMEYGAVYPKDSAGFYKRSLIESCVTKLPIKTTGGTLVKFHPSLTGDRNLQYVIAIDPASEHDNFSVLVLELHPDHRRIVYCWTTTKKLHRRRLKEGLTQESDFYGYCARKVRDLMTVFPCLRIVCDSQGGGVAVEEALHDTAKLREGEAPIWQIVEEDFKESDAYAGLHLLQMVNFADAAYTNEANHGLKKDMEDKFLLFPYFDALSLGFAEVEDEESERLYDTLQACVLEIEELKDELCQIEHTRTATGRDRWDTPEVKLHGSKKGRLRKDRYSALLMANMAGSWD